MRTVKEINEELRAIGVSQGETLQLLRELEFRHVELVKERTIAEAAEVFFELPAESRVELESKIATEKQERAEAEAEALALAEAEAAAAEPVKESES